MTDTLRIDDHLRHELEARGNRARRHHALDRGAAAGLPDAYIAAGAELILESAAGAARWLRTLLTRRRGRQLAPCQVTT